MAKRKKRRVSWKRTVSGWLSMPDADFYSRPVLHWDCGGALEVENCRTVLEYTSERVRLDLGSRQVQVLGDGLCLGGFTGRSLLIRGTVIRIELTEKEREKT